MDTHERTWVTETDPRLEPDRGPLQVLTSKPAPDGVTAP